MKVFLGNAPWYKDGMRGVRAGSRWPHLVPCGSPYKPFPFYLACAESLLVKSGFDVMLVDALAEEISGDEYFRRMKGFSPDLVVHEVATTSFKTDLRNGETVKIVLPESKLALCGPHYFMYDPDFLEKTDFVDFVARGEYEFSILELAESLREGRSPETVKGINYRQGGTAVCNPNRPLTPLDQFPWPAREFLPMEKYWDNPFEMPSPSLQMHTSRGCPFTCSFCAWPQIMYGSNKYRSRDPADVVDEILWCKKKFGIKSFYVDDDTFNIGKKRIIKLCDEIVKRKVNLPWSAMARADTTADETLLRLKEAGLHSIKYGVETGDQQILNSTGKRLDLDTVRETVRRTRELGIKCHLTFLFGLPGETMETARKTVEFANELDPDSLQFSIVTPYPGSSLYKEMLGKGFLLSDDFGEYDGNNRAVIRTEELSSADLERILREANRDWHRKTFFRRLWNNKLYYSKEFISHPLRYLKMFHKTVISP